jgi:epoxyqueuosine reductase
LNSVHTPQFSEQIKQLGQQLGFQAVGITDTRLDTQHDLYQDWIANNYHGEMSYMQRNTEKRFHPELMHPGTLSVICVRMDYLESDSEPLINLLDHPDKAYVSRYALGRDYHKLMRKRLQKFAREIQTIIGDFGYRVFTDSAPVLEKELAVKAGLGWRGKHSNILHREHGSWFFLGEIYTDLKLHSDQPLGQHCGDCNSCIDKCPTRAIIAPYVVDARRCISYLTIEHHSVIAEEYREAIGNRIYGCDDCQLYCPWNRFEKLTNEPDFKARHHLDDISLLECFSWSETQFLDRFEGSPVRRIGYEKWCRNLAIALGNAAASPHILNTLKNAKVTATPLVSEHIDWAIARQNHKLDGSQ